MELNKSVSFYWSPFNLLRVLELNNCFDIVPRPCSGARRQGKVLDKVSTVIHGDAVAMNILINGLSGALFIWQ